MVDNQLRGATGVGLMHFSVPKKIADRQHWSLWPRLSASPDQGSEQVSAHNHWCYELSVNLDEAPDLSHGVHNDIKLSLKDSGMWVMTSLLMAAHNVLHGPYNMDQRFGEVTGVLKDWSSKTLEARDSPLFMDFLPRMLHACGGDLKGDPRAADKMLTRFKESGCFMVKGAKTNLNRFMSVIKKGVEVCAEVPFRAFALSLT